MPIPLWKLFLVKVVCLLIELDSCGLDLLLNPVDYAIMVAPRFLPLLKLPVDALLKTVLFVACLFYLEALLLPPPLALLLPYLHMLLD
jgi:hypothetical protein